MAKLLSHFGLTEALISVTILALVALLLVVSIGESSKKERDAQRKVDVKVFWGAAEQFRADYGVYPNYAMRLGGEPAEAGTTLNFDVASRLTVCEQGNFKPDNFAVMADFATAATDYSQAYLKPGFNAVSRFLNCLGYQHTTGSDPVAAGTVYDYQYRVNHDGSKALAAATLERLNDSELSTLFNDQLLPQFYVGSGLLTPALDDDSDTELFFKAFAGRKAANGKYLYQCLLSVDKKVLTPSERLSKDYAPITDNNGSYAVNSRCLDSLDGLLAVEAN